MRKEETSVLNRIWSLIQVAGIMLAAVMFVIVAVNFLISQKDEPSLRAMLTVPTNNIIICEVNGDDSIEIVRIYSESTTQEDNPLLDPFYAGKAPKDTGYDLLSLYLSEEDSGDFQYKRADGESGHARFLRDAASGVVIVKFDDGITSWIDVNGVIASALVDKQHDNEVYIAFYDR